MSEAQIDKLPTCDFAAYDKSRDHGNAVYDGKTRQGPWAYMCENCFRIHGVGLGIGRGQMLKVNV